ALDQQALAMLVVGRHGRARDQRFSKGKGAGHGFNRFSETSNEKMPALTAGNNVGYMRPGATRRAARGKRRHANSAAY
ncbi:MAG TPA: hypothetical protein VGL08_08640, partial [Paraburkholderia sp.]